MRITYVILHYMAYSDTVECIESILESTKESLHETSIVVVDNASNNDSYAKLKVKYKDFNNIKLIHNSLNLGFAKGNNVGYMYAKKVLEADFIVLLNNDTIVNDSTINESIIEKYNKYNFSILGPCIKTIDGCYQNPREVVDWSNSRLFKFRFKKYIQLFLSNFKCCDRLLSVNKESFSKNKTNGDVIENIQLHGACLILSKNYIEKFNGLYSKTFLYMEEDILKMICDYYNLIMMYTSDINITHKEDVATNMIAKSSLQKKHNFYKNILNSSKVYWNLKNELKPHFLKTFVEKVAKKYKGIDYKIDDRISNSYLFSFSFERLLMYIRGALCHRKHKVFVGKRVKLICKNNIEFNNNVTIQDNCEINALSHDGVYLGKGASIGKNSIIRCSGNMMNIGVGFHIGNNSSLADFCFVGATGGVWIGDNVIGGQNIRFHSSNHTFNDLDTLIKDQGVTRKGIYVGNNCWIGAGTVFCDGVSIGDGCVIGANSVVTKSFGENLVIAGSPARVIKKRGE